VRRFAENLANRENIKMEMQKDSMVVEFNNFPGKHHIIKFSLNTRNFLDPIPSS
jgi:hypothetical protein